MQLQGVFPNLKLLDSFDLYGLQFVKFLGNLFQRLHVKIPLHSKARPMKINLEIISDLRGNKLPLSWITESEAEIFQIRLSCITPNMMILGFIFQSSFFEKFISFTAFQPFKPKKTINWGCYLALGFFWHPQEE